MDAILHRREPSTWELLCGNPCLFLAQRIYGYIQRRVQTSLSPDAIRIVCISDTHNRHESAAPLPDGDILIHAGDLTQSGTYEELDQALRWLSSQPHAHKFFIAGNHDAALADPQVVGSIRQRYPGLVYLEDDEVTVTVRGRVLNVYGNPYTPRHGSWVFQYPPIRPSQAATSTQWSIIPIHTDILITHAPPAYHLDKGGLGCPALLRSLWRVRPRLHVFGHIHASRGVEHVSWNSFQAAYERICQAQSGWWNLLALFAHAVREGIWTGTRGVGTYTTLVNASVVGGYRDELTRGAAVIDI